MSTPLLIPVHVTDVLSITTRSLRSLRLYTHFRNLFHRNQIPSTPRFGPLERSPPLYVWLWTSYVSSIPTPTLVVSTNVFYSVVPSLPVPHKLYDVPSSPTLAHETTGKMVHHRLLTSCYMVFDLDWRVSVYKVIFRKPGTRFLDYSWLRSGILSLWLQGRVV